jgi:serine/threonine protein kinase
MSGEIPAADEGRHPDSPARRIDAACDRFEAAWRSGHDPRIEDVLAVVDAADRPALLRELLALELELHRGRGERVTPGDYLGRFPAEADAIDVAFGEAASGARRASPRPSRSAADAGRNLLLGLLALQNNFVHREPLVGALNAWVADKSRPLGRILRDRGALDDGPLALLEALVAEHLKLHGDDTARSLAALSSIGSVRDDLERIGDADLRASLAATGPWDDQTGGDSGASPAGTSSSRRAGERFRILRFHREGGLGRVYVARDEELGRQVALKEIRPDKITESQLRTRFVLEAEINGGLEHPGIVPVYSLGTYDDGRPFYAMRFVEGDSLKETIESYHKGHPRPDPSAVGFRRMLGRFIDVCEAIAFAHSKGVLHRDLKPHNVMLGRYGETLLIDWGLAKATGRNEPDGTSAAAEAALVPPSGSGHAPTVGVLGSPPYMSPEQAAGAVDSLGPATDVYGLGAILFALLTGAPPVAGETTEEILERAIRGEIPPPRSLNPRIPRALEAVCLKALSLRPQDRYTNALALAEDVEHWLADEPVTAWPEPLWDRARRWMRRHRTLVTSTAAVLVFGIAGLAGFATVLANKNKELDDKNLALVDKNRELDAKNVELANKNVELTEQRKQAEAVSAFLVEAFRSPDPSQDGRTVKVVDILDRASQRLDRSFDGSQETRGALLDALGRTYYGLGLFERSAGHYDRAYRVREAALGPDDPSTLGSRNGLGAAYMAGGRASEAIAMHEGTLKLSEAKLGPDHPNTLRSRINLANAYYKAHRLSEAIPPQEQTLRLCEAQLGPDHPDTLISRGNLAIAYVAAGRLADAIPLFEAILKYREAKLGPDHPSTLISRNNLAAAYCDLGRFPEAIALNLQTLDLKERRLGPGHPETLVSRCNLAEACFGAGRSTEAIALLEATLGPMEVSPGADHPDTSYCRNLFATVRESLGWWDQAEPLRRDTLARRRRAVKSTDPALAGDLVALARNLLAQGQWSKAEPLLREAVAIYEKAAPDDWTRYWAMSLLGEVMIQGARPAEAEPLVLPGYQGLKASQGRIRVPDRFLVREAAHRVVHLYDSWGRLEDAAAWRARLGIIDLPADVFARP